MISTKHAKKHALNTHSGRMSGSWYFQDIYLSCSWLKVKLKKEENICNLLIILNRTVFIKETYPCPNSLCQSLRSVLSFGVFIAIFRKALSWKTSYHVTTWEGIVDNGELKVNAFAIEFGWRFFSILRWMWKRLRCICSVLIFKHSWEYSIFFSS